MSNIASRNPAVPVNTSISNEDLEFLQRVMRCRESTKFDLLRLQRGLVGYHRHWENSDPLMQIIKHMRREAK